MSAAVLRYSYEGEEFRVVVADDVVAVPNDGWSWPGFGHEISISWMLTTSEAPLKSIRPARRRLIAELVRRALADVHGYNVPDCRLFLRIENNLGLGNYTWDRQARAYVANGWTEGNLDGGRS